MNAKLFTMMLLTFSAVANTQLDMNTINIEGTYDSSNNVSQADQIRNYRRKLEEQNEQMLKKKIETLRLQQELELMKKVQAAFNQSMQNLNNIQ